MCDHNNISRGRAFVIISYLLLLVQQRKIHHMYIIKWFFFLSLSSLQWISIIIFIFWESEEKTNEKICDYLRQDNSKSLHTLNAVLHYSKLSVFWKNYNFEQIFMNDFTRSDFELIFEDFKRVNFGFITFF